MQIIVKDQQSLLDVAVQYLGSAEAVFALAERNGISITDRLRDGQALQWEVTDIGDAKVQKLYKLHSIIPATDIDDLTAEMLLSITDEYTEGCNVPQFARPFDEHLNGYDMPSEGSQFSNGTNEVGPDGRIILTRIFADQFNDVFA